MKPLRIITDLVYPPFCEICGSKLTVEERYICSFCLKKIRINSRPFCKFCSRHLSYERELCNECITRKSYIEQVWSWGIYDGILKKCIHLFKYKKKVYLLNLFKNSLFEFLEQNLIMKNIDIIIPVPLYVAKLKERTFNQAQILARIFTKHYKIRTINALKKVKATQPQNKLSKLMRQQNVKGVFIVEKAETFYKKRVLIVDDIFTTGSTLNECAKMLLKAGAEIVYGFTLARGL